MRCGLAVMLLAFHVCKVEASPLIEPSSKGDLSAVEQLIAGGVDVKATNAKGETATHWACSSGNLQLVKYLHEHQASITKSSTAGLTPLMIACMKGHGPVAGYLVQNGASVSKKSKAGKSSLDYMAEPTSKALANSVTHLTEKAALRATLLKACWEGEIEMVARCLALGTNVDIFNHHGQTPIHLAARKGYIQIVELLILHGALLDVRDFSKCTPLHDACREGHFDTAVMLLKNGAKNNPLNQAAKAPWNYCSDNDRKQVFATLKESAAVPSLRQRMQMAESLSVLGVKCEQSVIEEFLSRGSSINDADAQGRTCLHYASATGNVKGVRYLLSLKANPTQTDKTALSPIYYATAFGHAECLELLLNACTSSYPKDVYGYGYLDYAKCTNQSEMAESVFMRLQKSSN